MEQERRLGGGCIACCEYACATYMAGFWAQNSLNKSVFWQIFLGFGSNWQEIVKN